MLSSHYILIIVLLLSLIPLSISVLQKSMISQGRTSRNPGCTCIDYDCGCCEYVNLGSIGIHGTICINFTYLPHDYGIAVTLTYNNYTLYNETVSARNPPPFCIGIPEFEKIGAEICLRLYNLSFGNNNFHGCLEVTVSVYHIVHKTITIGCFNLPNQKYKSLHTYPNKINEAELDYYHYKKQQYKKNKVIEPTVQMI